MGQKVHPFVLRLGFIRNWHSRWFANSPEYGLYIKEDYDVRKLIKKRFKLAGVSKIIIERLTNKVKVTIYCGRPGIVIGRHGADIERLREDLNTLLQKDIGVDVKEVDPIAKDAQLISENVANQLEKRIAFRRAVKRAMEQSMNAGVKGIRVCCAGRLNGAEMSRTETYKLGKVPLQTLRADIEYGFSEALTTYGLIGVKVWVYHGDILSRNSIPLTEAKITHTPKAKLTPAS
ncbi:MAG: 30S ribosomal protein S3 [Candidatus Omnitrophica bacterium]|nr:30S ribosomal protein S3 [Candidatus Omnitrophota bacterium]